MMSVSVPNGAFVIGYPFSKDCLPLGFGCAWRNGGRQMRRSLRLGETAFDEGVRYFDTARMYGFGEAEGVLGEFLPARRDDIIVTSKAGIMPTPGGEARRWVRRGAKLAHHIFRMPMLRHGDFRFGMFDTPSLKKSVETSLFKLRTDRLDALLLHEVDEYHLTDGAVMALLDELRSSGFDRADRQHGAGGWAGPPDGLGPLGDQRRYLTITHSVLAEALDKIMTRLAADDAFRKQWAALTGVDPASRENVAELLLAEALDANRGGVVLFSTRSPERIKAAARVARENPHAQDQLKGLRKLAATMNTGGKTCRIDWIDATN